MGEKIHTNAAQGAVLKFTDGTPEIPTLTLQEAIIAYRNLTREKQALACIETEGGERYEGDEIDRLYKA